MIQYDDDEEYEDEDELNYDDDESLKDERFGMMTKNTKMRMIPSMMTRREYEDEDDSEYDEEEYEDEDDSRV